MKDFLKLLFAGLIIILTNNLVCNQEASFIQIIILMFVLQINVKIYKNK